MEHSEKYTLKLRTYHRAIISFEKSLQLDLNDYPQDVAEVIKNGQIQKFEFSCEYTWKIVKQYLIEVHKIDAKSPAIVIKEFYLLGMINDEQYTLFFKMIESRNLLSHVYNEEHFNNILQELPNFLLLMKEIEKIVSEKEY